MTWMTWTRWTLEIDERREQGEGSTRLCEDEKNELVDVNVVIFEGSLDSQTFIDVLRFLSSLQ